MAPITGCVVSICVSLLIPLELVLMAWFRRRNVAQAFRNNTQLQQFVLTDVTPTGRVLGTGSYGSVEEVCLPNH